MQPVMKWMTWLIFQIDIHILQKKKNYVTPCVSSDNQLYAVVDVGYEGQDTTDAANHDKWLSENNFFQYLSEKNEWILLPPMPKVGRYTYGPAMFHMEEYIYVIGQFDDNYCFIQRFSLLSQSWENLVEDTLLAPHDSILLPTGQILTKGSQQRAGPNLDGSPNGYFVVVVALYRPATNELLDVSVEGTLDEQSFLVKHDNDYYELISSYDGDEDQVNRLICDFESDKPTMVIAEATEDEKCAVIDMQFGPEFTFDKRKLGLVQVPCDCESHVKSESK